jgi:uncharacterized protein (DUF697 family)
LSENQQVALKTIKNYMWLSIGASLIPVPWVDLAAVGGVQLRMLAEISKIYGVPFQENRGKAIIASLTGFVLPHALAYNGIGSLLKHIPGLGSLAGAPMQALFCGAYAWALGNVFIQHFEAGGTFLNFDPERIKEYFREKFREGRTVSASIGTPESADAPA